VRIKWSRKKANTYVHDAPGDLVHVDIKKLGRIPDGGGWKVHGRQNRPNLHHRLGYAFIHTAVDDHSRLAYSEIHADERAATAAGFWSRANAWFGSCGIQVRAVLTDIQSGWAASPPSRRPAGRIGVVRHLPVVVA
jgi:hypothetical protein